jgi:CRP-like cAMP-binding protein
MWEGKVFESLMEQFPLLRTNVLSDFHKLLSQMEERFREICTLTVAPRVSGELARLVPRVGKKDEHGHKLSLSQKDLAQLTGTTLFTVNRILNQWELDGIVKTQRNAILVRDVPALVKMSHVVEG